MVGIPRVSLVVLVDELGLHFARFFLLPLALFLPTVIDSVVGRRQTVWVDVVARVVERLRVAVGRRLVLHGACLCWSSAVLQSLQVAVGSLR
mgnify:CR=1 FL=1